MSTNEKRKKSKGREYESPPPITCMPKELDVLVDKWIAMEFSSSAMFLESPLRTSGEICITVGCAIMCITLLQNAGHSADWSTAKSRKGLLS